MSSNSGLRAVPSEKYDSTTWVPATVPSVSPDRTKVGLAPTPWTVPTVPDVVHSVAMVGAPNLH